MPKVLITGAAGFIGSSLADNLLENGHSVMGIDNFDPFYDRGIKELNLVNALKNPDYQLREGDIRDKEFIDDTFSFFNPDIVVHLAAKAGVRPSLTDPVSYFDVNVMGTLNILEMMKKRRINKMIFGSSSSVYGNNRKVPFSEDDNVDYPVSPYASTKKAGELLCHTYHHLYNMDIFCLRFFTVYGPRQRPDLAIHKFVRLMVNDKVITVYGDGSTSRDYTYIKDIIKGISAAIERVNGYEVFNLGSTQPITLTELIGLLENKTGRRAHIRYLPMQDGDVERTHADISKSNAMLGYKPETDIGTGLEMFINWFTRSVSAGNRLQMD